MRIPESENLDPEVWNQGVQRNCSVALLGPWGLLGIFSISRLAAATFQSLLWHNMTLSLVCLSLYIFSFSYECTTLLQYDPVLYNYIWNGPIRSTIEQHKYEMWGSTYMQIYFTKYVLQYYTVHNCLNHWMWKHRYKQLTVKLCVDFWLHSR